MPYPDCDMAAIAGLELVTAYFWDQISDREGPIVVILSVRPLDDDPDTLEVRSELVVA